MNEKTIKFEGKSVAVRMMDDRYIVSDCPQQPEHVDILKGRNGTRCDYMGVIPGQTPSVKEVIEDARTRHGNCAVLAWDGDYVVGILTFFPVEDLVSRKAKGWEQMQPYCNIGVLAIGSCVLCSLVGHEYRGKGIGRAMAELMLDWAREKSFKQVGAFYVSSGLASMHFRDHCRPPKLFWEKLGFSVVSKQLSAQKWSEVKAGFEKEIQEAEGNEDEKWKLTVFPEYFQQVESSDLPFSEFDARFSLIREL